MLRRILIAAVVCSTALILPSAALAAAPSSAPTITVELDCDAGGYVVTSDKRLSNVVVRNTSGEDTKTLYGDEDIYSIVVAPDDVTVIWVKSGSYRSGDGPGYGERFDVEPTTCGPRDLDLDGYDSTVDCNDGDPSINPGAVDVPNNGIDENCDGSDLVVGDGQVRATLTWGTDDDLDLHVVDPHGARLYYDSKTSASGGELDRDDNVNSCGNDLEPGGVENTFWPAGGAPSGTYEVEVYSYRDCLPVGSDWHLQVFVDGNVVIDESGTFDGTGTPILGRGLLIYSGTFSVA